MSCGNKRQDRAHDGFWQGPVGGEPLQALLSTIAEP